MSGLLAQPPGGMGGGSLDFRATVAPPQSLPAAGMSATADQVIAHLMPILTRERPSDFTDAMPPELARYAAGLRPTTPPAGAPWQQEVIFERPSRDDREINETARYYYSIAQNYDMYLSRERVTASNYYAGRPLGDEQRGRSQIVLTTVRDTIRATMPSLLRIFTGVENPVEFVAPADQDGMPGVQSDALARQATDYARWALFTANDGWQILHDTLLDALARRAGWVRWYWGALRAARTDECFGLLLPQLQALLAQPGVTAQRVVRRPMSREEAAGVQASPEGQQYLGMGGPPEIYSARITRQAARPWPRLEAVPPECVWIVADAETVGRARAVFHVRDTFAGDLIADGLPAAKVLAHTETNQNPRTRRERIARDQASGYNFRGAAPNDASMRIVRYVEGFIRMDTDGDNIPELLHVHMLGNNTELIQWERTDEIPLACFTPYREPGRVIGMSQADMTIDLQKTSSRVMRATLDSLGQSIFPRTVAIVNQVNMQDVRQTAIGSIIRATQAGAVTELAKPFLGDQALNVMQALEVIREQRTGITRASQGLTAEHLQSTAPIAVAAQTSASQDRIDMMARTLAETGLAPLYLGLIRMLARRQDRPNVVKIRGEWVPMDPRALAVMWAVKVNIGGRGTPAERLTVLTSVAARQEQIIQQGGMDNPLCGLPEYRNTLVRMLELANVSDPASYFKPLPPGWQPPPPPPPQPTSDQILAGVEREKTMAGIVNNREEARTDRMKATMEDDRERDQAALDAWVKSYAIAAQYGTPLPSISEFRTAMKGVVSPLGDIAAANPIGALSPGPAAGPGVPVGYGRMLPPPPAQPGAVTPRGVLAGAPAAGGPPDPATVLAMRQAVARGGSVTPMGVLQNRAVGAVPGGAGPSGGAP